MLGASVGGHKKIAKRIRKLSFVQIHQDGDFGELTVIFHIDYFDEIAKIMRPKKRRRLSEKQKSLSIDRLRPHCFKKTEQSPARQQSLRDQMSVSTPKWAPRSAEDLRGPKNCSKVDRAIVIFPKSARF